MKIALISTVIAAIVAVVAYVLQRLANEALIHMMLEKGINVNEQEFKRHSLECLRHKFKQSEQQEPARQTIDTEELTKAILRGLESATGSFKTDRASTDDKPQA